MFILCEGKVASKPYEMPFTGDKLYSLEELSYYLYHKIYTLTDDFFNLVLAVWLREQAGHPVLAGKIEKMLLQQTTLKDMVVTILCGCDYFREEEIREVVKIIDEIANLPVHKKKKRKADNYLRAGRYGKSLLEYRKLLYGSFAVNFTPEEYGDLLHNQGIAHFYVASFAEAERDFKDAFARNNKKSSLKHYLWLLLIQNKVAEFESEAVELGLQAAEINSIRSVYKEALLGVQVPEESPEDLVSYKKQLVRAYAG